MFPVKKSFFLPQNSQRTQSKILAWVHHGGTEVTEVTEYVGKGVWGFGGKRITVIARNAANSEMTRQSGDS